VGAAPGAEAGRTVTAAATMIGNPATPVTTPTGVAPRRPPEPAAQPFRGGIRHRRRSVGDAGHARWRHWPRTAGSCRWRARSILAASAQLKPPPAPVPPPSTTAAFNAPRSQTWTDFGYRGQLGKPGTSIQYLAPNVTRPPQPSADPHSCRNPDSHVRSAGPAPFRTYSPRVRWYSMWYSMPARVWVRGCWSLLVGHRGRHGPHAVLGV